MFASAVPPEDVDAFRDAMEKLHPAGFRALARASAEDLSDVPSAVARPTLLVYGDRDERAPLSVAEALHREIANSRLVVLEGVGHVCNIEAPQRFNDSVRAFLESNPTSPMRR
jgi:pimeloyl-ACP methyl ester carboxylesterase